MTKIDENGRPIISEAENDASRVSIYRRRA